MCKILFAALLTLTLVPTVAAAATDSDHVELKIDEVGAITVPVTINGQGPFRFMLDTGSNRSAVSSDVASLLALPVVAKAVMVTSTGSQNQLVVRLDAMAIGTAARAGLPASVIPAVQLKAAMPGIDGIVGQDFMSDFDYTLDYRKQRLSWTAEAAGDKDVRLVLVKKEGRFLVELPQGDKTLRFVPDSGADGFVIFEHDGAAAVALDALDAQAELISMTGSQNVKPMMLRRLQVGSTTVKNERALLVQRNEPDAPEGDGLLPLHLFASVSFNTRDGYLIARR